MPGMDASVSLLYVGTSIFAFCIVLVFSFAFCCYVRLTKTARVLPPEIAITSAASKQLTLKEKERAYIQGPRDVTTVRSELIAALTTAEELKAELDMVMAEQQKALMMEQHDAQATGPSFAAGYYKQMVVKEV